MQTYNKIYSKFTILNFFEKNLIKMQTSKRQYLIRGQITEIEFPCVMGIINVTPDSFYDQSRFNLESEICSRVKSMIEYGAKIIDIGGLSSRPFSDVIDENEELKRVLPALKSVRLKFPEILISIDTFRSEVANACASEGADFINDISAGKMDSNMFKVVAKNRIPYIMMHMQGTPENMQVNPQYNNLINEVQYYFAFQIKKALETGINDVIIDPGFGFGKTIEHNFELLNKLELLKIHNKAILVGLSRKSMINKVLGINPKDALNGTTTLNTVAISKGADILRVHDVKEAMEVIKLLRMMDNEN